MKKLLLCLLILVFAAATHFLACGDDDDSVGDDDADDDADDTGDDTGDDTSDDDLVDDDITDDDFVDDDTSTGCDEDSGLPVTICNPIYANTLDYNETYIGWPMPITVTYDGAIQEGYQIALDCSNYGENPMPISLAIYVGGPEQGAINTSYVYPDRQTGPFYENQDYTCQLFIADGDGEAASNDLNIAVTMGPKS